MAQIFFDYKDILNQSWDHAGVLPFGLLMLWFHSWSFKSYNYSYVHAAINHFAYLNTIQSNAYNFLEGYHSDPVECCHASERCAQLCSIWYLHARSTAHIAGALLLQLIGTFLKCDAVDLLHVFEDGDSTSGLPSWRLLQSDIFYDVYTST